MGSHDKHIENNIYSCDIFPLQYILLNKSGYSSLIFHMHDKTRLKQSFRTFYNYHNDKSRN